MTLLGNISSGLFEVFFLLHLPLLAAVTEPPDPWQHVGLGSSATNPHPHQGVPSPPDGVRCSALGGLKLVLGLMAEQEGGSWGQQGEAGQGLPGPSRSPGPARSPRSQWQPPVRFHGSGKINVDEAAREGEETLVASGLMSPPFLASAGSGGCHPSPPVPSLQQAGHRSQSPDHPGSSCHQPDNPRIPGLPPAPLTLIRPLPPTWADPAQPRGAARGSE